MCPIRTGRSRNVWTTIQHFVDMIKKCTHNTAPLKVVASDIDEACAWVHPKVLKRIDIGPILSMYDRTEDEQAKEIGRTHTPAIS
jgi:hypothetical protein